MNDPKWALEAIQLSHAIPSFDFLSGKNVWLDTISLGQVSTEDSCAFAAAMYRLKEGQSVSVCTPAPSANTITQLLIYLHRCRLDSRMGCNYAGWLNPHCMKDKLQLLCFTRPISRFPGVSEIPGTTTHIINKIPNEKQARNLETNRKEIGETILINPGNNYYELIEYLAKKINPFYIVIDATPTGGKKDINLLWHYLAELFPNTPKLVIFATGDIIAKEIITNLQINLWHQRPLDVSTIPNRELSKRISINIAKNADNTFDQLLNKATLHCKDLLISLQASEKRKSRLIISPLYKVLRILGNLPCPYGEHKLILEQNRRGGLFPVRPLNEIIQKVSEINAPTGESQNNLNLACKAIAELIKLCESGTQGKAQALKKIIQNNKNKTITIVVDDQYISLALKTWLQKECVLLPSQNNVTILPAEGLTDLDKLKFSNTDVVIWLAKAWKNRFWWFLYSSEFIWPVYPGESGMAGKLLAYNITDELMTSEKSKNKSNWWAYQNIKHEKDGQNVNDTHISQSNMPSCTGSYKLEYSIDIPLVESTSWLDLLTSADEDVAKWEKEAVEIDYVNYVWIYTEEQDVPLKIPSNTLVDVLSTDGKQSLEQVLATDIKEGEKIFQLSGGESRDTLREMLYNLFSRKEKGNIDQVRLFAQLWYQYCDGALKKFNQDHLKLHQEISRQGIDITIEGLKGWLSHKYIGPQNDSAINVMAFISGIGDVSKNPGLVKKCIKELRAENIKIGKAINYALRKRAEGATTIKFGDTNIDVNTLDELIDVATVTHVEIKLYKDIIQDNLSLKDSILGIVEEFSDNITFTPRALRSIAKSPFKDTEKATSCIRILATLFHKVYLKNTTFEKIKPTLEALSITFASGMSELAKGKTGEYSATYKGKTVDTGKHLRISSSRNPDFCFRVHYHWDDEDKKIVVHHAGRHLKTSKD